MKQFLLPLAMFISGSAFSATVDCNFFYGTMNSEMEVSQSFAIGLNSVEFIDAPGSSTAFLVNLYYETETNKHYMAINKRSDENEEDYGLVASGNIAFDGSAYRIVGTTDNQTKVAFLECKAQPAS